MADNIIETPKTKLGEDQRNAACKTLVNIISYCNFLKQCLMQDTYDDNILSDGMDLMRHYYEDLARDTGKERFLSDKLEDAYKQLREARKETDRIKKQIGESVTTDKAIAHIRTLVRQFETWYQLCGFHYAQIEYSGQGIYADFSCEIEMPCPEEERVYVTFGDEEIAMQVAHAIPYLFDKGYSLYRYTFHSEMLDCDTNRKKLQKLFEKTFPGSRMISFSSRFQDGSPFHKEPERSLLRTKVYIPYGSIDLWYDKALKKSGGKNNKKQQKEEDKA